MHFIQSAYTGSVSSEH